MNEIFVVYLLHSFTNLSKEVEDLFLLEWFFENFFQIITISMLHNNEEFTFLMLVKFLKSKNALLV
jgi:hypothetical protein